MRWKVLAEYILYVYGSPTADAVYLALTDVHTNACILSAPPLYLLFFFSASALALRTPHARLATARTACTRPRPRLAPNARSSSKSLPRRQPRRLGTNPRSARRDSLTPSRWPVARGWWIRPWIRPKASIARYIIRRERRELLYRQHWIAFLFSPSYETGAPSFDGGALTTRGPDPLSLGCRLQF